MNKKYFKMLTILLTCSALFSTVTYAGTEKPVEIKQIQNTPQLKKTFQPGLNTGIQKSLASSTEYVADTWSGIIPKGTQGKVMQVYTLSRFTIKKKSTVAIKVKQQKTENITLSQSMDYFLVPDSDFSNRIGDSLTLFNDYPGTYGSYAYTHWTNVLPGTYVVRVRQGYTPYKTTGEVIVTPNE